jgi:hypothetical protein
MLCYGVEGVHMTSGREQQWAALNAGLKFRVS